MTEKAVRKWKLPLLILGLLVLLLAVLKLSQPTPPKTESPEKAWRVNTETLVLKSAQPQIALLGTVDSPFDSLLSAALSADVVQVLVREGQSVEKDSLLVSLDQRELTLALAQRQADVEDAKAQIDAEKHRHAADKKILADETHLKTIAEQALSRQRQLKASNLVAQERLEQAESQLAQSSLAINARELSITDHPSRLKQLQAKLTRAKAAYAQALIDLERTQIKAPYAGVITAVHVAPGERVQSGQALIRLYNSQDLEIRAQIPDRHLAQIRLALSNGKTIQAHAERYGQAVELSLARLSGQANRGAGGVDALFSPKLNTTAATLPLNSTVKVFVDLPALNHVATLPVSALYANKRIYRIVDERLEALEVEQVGARFDSQGRSRVIVKGATLKAGDQIVTTQLPNAISGLKVSPRES